MSDDVECLWQGDKVDVVDDSFHRRGGEGGVGAGLMGPYADVLSDSDSVCFDELTWRWDPEISLSDWTIRIGV